jgi:hypothetical protein
MDHPYHVTVFDSFHRHEPEEAWVSGTYATAEAAIAAVKRKIDDELEYFWSEVCHQDKGIATLDRLISHYNSFAEAPVAFGADHKTIFNSTAYVIAMAAEVVTEPPAPYGPAAPAAHVLSAAGDFRLDSKPAAGGVSEARIPAFQSYFGVPEHASKSHAAFGDLRRPLSVLWFDLSGVWLGPSTIRRYNARSIDLVSIQIVLQIACSIGGSKLI